MAEPVKYEAHHCKVKTCDSIIRVKEGDEVPRACGRVECQAALVWNEEEWEGRARMAAARESSGVPLNQLDRDALNRRAKRKAS